MNYNMTRSCNMTFANKSKLYLFVGLCFLALAMFTACGGGQDDAVDENVAAPSGGEDDGGVIDQEEGRGDLIPMDEEQAKSVLAEMLKGELTGGKSLVAKGEGVMNDQKAWFFNLGEDRYAVSEDGNVWGMDMFNKWINLSEN